MTQCNLCEQNTGLLDFSRPCCVARYISSLKWLQQRKAWLERLRKRKDAEFMDQVEQRVKAIWQERSNDRSRSQAE